MYFTEYIMKDITIEEIKEFITKFEAGDTEKFYTLFEPLKFSIGVNPHDDLPLFILKLSKEYYDFKYMYQIEIKIQNCLNVNALDFIDIKPELYFDCFIWSLIVNGLPYSLWNDIEFMTIGQTGSDTTSTTWFTRICNKYNMAIKVYTYDETTNRIDALNSKNHRWFGDKDKAKYKAKICGYEGHWFAYEKMNISVFAIEHMDEIRMNPYTFYWSEDDLLRVTAIKNGKPVINKNVKTSNLKIVMALHKNNCFEPLNRDDPDVKILRQVRGAMYMTPQQRKQLAFDSPFTKH
jgi:hypothetical protein